MTTIPSEVLEDVEASGQLSDIDLSSGIVDGDEPGPSRRNPLAATIERLHETLAVADEGTATRVTVHDLGSLDWGEITSHVRPISKTDARAD
jgi:elongator complex protein 4